MATTPDSFDFELTDFDEARQALEEPPAGVREMANLTPGYWEARRRKILPSDKALTGAAIDWLISLPSEIRPKALCDRFPRIVNQLALWWDDRTLATDALKHLLSDERGGRKGFAQEVADELNRLLDHAMEPQASRPRG